jgi:hypothetical protein
VGPAHSALRRDWAVPAGPSFLGRCFKVVPVADDDPRIWRLVVSLSRELSPKVGSRVSPLHSADIFVIAAAVPWKLQHARKEGKRAEACYIDVTRYLLRHHPPTPSNAWLTSIKTALARQKEE